MKLYSTITLAALYVGSTVAIAVTSRQDSPTVECIEAVHGEGIYQESYSPACVNLISNCLKELNTTSYIWHKTSCVAAATCDGITNLISLAQNCDKEDVADAPDTPTLSYNIYANIVGECAWQEGGCPITQQNYIDFVYGALSAVNSTEWPSDVSQVISLWWDPILSWADTGDTLPYTNFDDWLHYSNS